jgi:tetratricopeptide (TPR) repeat protein
MKNAENSTPPARNMRLHLRICQWPLFIWGMYITEGNTIEAEKSYRIALEKDPLNADAHNNLAWLYLTQRKKLDEAHRLVLRALELNPAKAGIYRDTLDKIEQNWKK